MSHFTTIHTQIRDLGALGDACADLGIQLATGPKCRGYGGVRRTCAHVICLKGPYDIAVDPDPKHPGTFGLTTDWWDGHVVRETGENHGRLLQSYGIHKTLHEARKRGLRATRRTREDGAVLVTLEGGAL